MIDRRHAARKCAHEVIEYFIGGAADLSRRRRAYPHAFAGGRRAHNLSRLLSSDEARFDHRDQREHVDVHAFAPIGSDAFVSVRGDKFKG